jgi:hypothetical protein
MMRARPIRRASSISDFGGRASQPRSPGVCGLVKCGYGRHGARLFALTTIINLLLKGSGQVTWQVTCYRCQQPLLTPPVTEGGRLFALQDLV